MTKTCTVCKALKQYDDFSKNSTRKDGYDNRCKTCYNEYIQNNWSRTIVRMSRSNDKRDHRPIDGAGYIDETWVTELVRNNPNCHYCYVPLKFGLGTNRNTDPCALQLDRMDSLLPHLKSNCVTCCRTCNQRFQTIPYQWKVSLSGK